MLRYQIIPVTHFEQNCSLLWCDQTMQAALVDPGGEPEKLLRQAQVLGVTLVKIFVTHGHIDHAGAVAALARKHSLRIEGPQRKDLFWIEQLAAQGHMFGLGAAETFVPDRWLEDGDSVTLGHEALSVRHCPGHTPGHVVFHHEASQRVWVGDVLFRGSIGRTDFPQGDFDTLIASIRTRLWPMGDATGFIPGHGPESTLGFERLHNPFVAD